MAFHLQEYSEKEVLKLSFPYSRVPSTLVEMLQYCSNVQRLSLPCSELDSKQLRSAINCMGCLHTLELWASKYIYEVEELLRENLQYFMTIANIIVTMS